MSPFRPPFCKRTDRVESIGNTNGAVLPQFCQTAVIHATMTLYIKGKAVAGNPVKGYTKGQCFTPGDGMSHLKPVISAVFALAILFLGACGDPAEQNRPERTDGISVFDLLSGGADADVTVGVNKYLWNASLEVLNFLPVQSADPFSGVLTTGFGTPPGGRTAYRATILIQDPALDARSLNVALMTRSGPVNADTRTSVEDAILTRARQLRQRDLGL